MCVYVRAYTMSIQHIKDTCSFHDLNHKPDGTRFSGGAQVMLCTSINHIRNLVLSESAVSVIFTWQEEFIPALKTYYFRQSPKSSDNTYPVRVVIPVF